MKKKTELEKRADDLIDRLRSIENELNALDLLEQGKVIRGVSLAIQKKKLEHQVGKYMK